MSTFKSPRSLATVVTVLLALNALWSVGMIVSGVAQLELLARIPTGDFTDAELVANDQREQLMGIGTMVLYLVTAVGFIAWFKRAYDNVAAVGWETFHTRGWAIGAWFVPILNLYRPLQIAREIWHKSERVPEPGGEGVRSDTPTLLSTWWAAWIVGNVLGQIALRLSLRAESAGDFEASTLANLVADVASLVAAPLAIRVVRAITEKQERTGGSTEPLEF